MPHPHFIFEALAYAAGFQVFLILRRRRGDPVAPSTRWTVVAAAAVGAALGSKLLYWLENPALTWQHRGDPFFLMAGKSIVGGLLGGLIAVEWTKRRIGERRSTGDLFALPLCLGIAIGRIGCFLSGLEDGTYGTATALPWGVDFGDGIARHPTQIYESLFAIALGGWLWRRSTRPHPNGAIFREFMVAYLAFRLGVDFLKPIAAWGGLAATQWAAFAGVVYYRAWPAASVRTSSTT